MTPVYCRECDHNQPGQQPWQDFCRASPLDWSEGFGFVTRDQWDSAPPFKKCVKVNAYGTCTKYEPKRGDRNG